jgi:PAS domain S-box-containing protein
MKQNDSTRKIRRCFDLADVILLVLDREGRIELINRKGCEILGRPREVITGMNWFDEFVPAPNNQWIKSAYHRFMEGLKSPGYFENPIIAEGGAWHIIRWSIEILIDEKGVRSGAACSGEDITEKRQTEVELKASQKRLHNLSTHLVSCREEERAYIAREVHDEFGQSLTALKFDLLWLKKRLIPDHHGLIAKIDTMEALIASTVSTVQRLTERLRPVFINDLGIVAALEWQVMEFQERMLVQCELSCSPRKIALDRERSTALCRIVQEALTNVARHARATRLKIRLTKRCGKISLTVNDNGIGIAGRHLDDPHSMGLEGLRERARFLGGAALIKGVKGEGTTVCVTFPA